MKFSLLESSQRYLQASLLLTLVPLGLLWEPRLRPVRSLRGCRRQGVGRGKKLGWFLARYQVGMVCIVPVLLF